MSKENIQQWWADSHFWDEYAPLMFDEQRLKDAVGNVEQIIKITGITAPDTEKDTENTARILDLGCGPGRHSNEFARRGFQVTGIDLHEPYLESARNDGVNIVPKPEYICCDMREYRTDHKFNGAVSLFQSLGYFDSLDDEREACRRVFESLESGGWFVLEMDGKEASALNFEAHSWFERDGRLILLENEAIAAWSRLRNRWMFRDVDGSWHEYEFEYRLFSAEELGGLLESAGFASIEFFGDFDGRPYNHEAQRLVALALKS